MTRFRQGPEEVGRLAQQSGQTSGGAWYPQPEHNVEGVQRPPALAHRFTKKPPHVIALHRAGKLLFANDETHPTDRVRCGYRKQLEMRSVEAPPCLEQAGKGRGAPQPVALVRADRGRGQKGNARAGCGVQTASRTRPFARRARNTLRPPILFMRARKPWVRLRRTTEGW